MSDNSPVKSAEASTPKQEVNESEVVLDFGEASMAEEPKRQYPSRGRKVEASGEEPMVPSQGGEQSFGDDSMSFGTTFSNMGSPNFGASNTDSIEQSGEFESFGGFGAESGFAKKEARPVVDAPEKKEVSSPPISEVLKQESATETGFSSQPDFGTSSTVPGQESKGFADSTEQDFNFGSFGTTQPTGPEAQPTESKEESVGFGFAQDEPKEAVAEKTESKGFGDVPDFGGSTGFGGGESQGFGATSNLGATQGFGGATQDFGSFGDSGGFGGGDRGYHRNSGGNNRQGGFGGDRQGGFGNSDGDFSSRGGDFSSRGGDFSSRGGDYGGRGGRGRGGGFRRQGGGYDNSYNRDNGGRGRGRGRGRGGYRGGGGNFGDRSSHFGSDGSSHFGNDRDNQGGFGGRSNYQSGGQGDYRSNSGFQSGGGFGRKKFYDEGTTERWGKESQPNPQPAISSSVESRPAVGKEQPEEPVKSKLINNWQDEQLKKEAFSCMSVGLKVLGADVKITNRSVTNFGKVDVLVVAFISAEQILYGREMLNFCQENYIDRIAQKMEKGEAKPAEPFFYKCESNKDLDTIAFVRVEPECENEQFAKGLEKLVRTIHAYGLKNKGKVTDNKILIPICSQLGATRTLFLAVVRTIDDIGATKESQMVLFTTDPADRAYAKLSRKGWQEARRQLAEDGMM